MMKRKTLLCTVIGTVISLGATALAYATPTLKLCHNQPRVHAF